jgi:uncharacterized protein YjeT (DUF2065 family)
VNRFAKMVILIIGLVAVVFGVIFMVQYGSARQQVANDIAPMPLNQVNASYDLVKAKQEAIMAQEEPNIQAGKAEPSAMYNYLTIQRTSLGLAKANLGLADFIRMMGIINIVIGVGLVLTGIVVPGKK